MYSLPLTFPLSLLISADRIYLKNASVFSVATVISSNSESQKNIYYNRFLTKYFIKKLYIIITKL